MRRLCKMFRKRSISVSPVRERLGTTSKQSTDLPLDVLKSRGSKERERKIANPVEESSQRDRFAADIERNDLRGVGPSQWSGKNICELDRPDDLKK